MNLAAIQPSIPSLPSLDIHSGEGFGLLLGLLAVMSIVPFVMTLTTSFAKFVIVLGLVRQALGTQQTPPNMIITGIALILTIHVMWPVGEKAYANYVAAERARAGAPTGSADAGPTGKPDGNPDGKPDGRTLNTDTLMRMLVSAQMPIHDYLKHNSEARYVGLFEDLTKRKTDVAAGTSPTLREELRTKHPQLAGAVDDLIVYAPAFLLTELSEAFQIGFMVFIPFLVIDLVVGNVLLAMGMQMLTPQTIALPLKLLLFVAVGGWQLIITGLLQGYV